MLSEGTKHYRTEDRGRTWRSFEVPLPPATVSSPLSFHSDPKRYGNILYQGMRCEPQGWGSVCHDEVNLIPFTPTANPPLTFHRRHFTQKKRSAMTQNSSSPKQSVVNSYTAAKTSKQTYIQTSYSALVSTPPLQPTPSPSPPPVSSLAPTSSPQPPKSKTSE